MPAIIACPKCQSKLAFDESAVGKNIRCPKCQQVFCATLPAAPPPIASPVTAQPPALPPPLPTPPPARPLAAVPATDERELREAVRREPPVPMGIPLPAEDEPEDWERGPRHRRRRRRDWPRDELPDAEPRKEDAAATKKPSPVMQAIGIGAGIIGAILGRVVGLPVLIVCVFGAMIGVPLHFLTTGRRRYMAAAAGVQGGHAMWMLFGAVLIAAGAVPGLEVSKLVFLEGIFFLIGAIVVALVPSLFTVIPMTVYQVVGFVMNVVVLTQAAGAPEVGKALLLHMALRVFGVVLMFEALFRKEETAPPPVERGWDDEAPAAASSPPLPPAIPRADRADDWDNERPRAASSAPLPQAFPRADLPRADRADDWDDRPAPPRRKKTPVGLVVGLSIGGVVVVVGVVVVLVLLLSDRGAPPHGKGKVDKEKVAGDKKMDKWDGPIDWKDRKDRPEDLDKKADFVFPLGDGEIVRVPDGEPDPRYHTFMKLPAKVTAAAPQKPQLNPHTAGPLSPGSPLWAHLAKQQATGFWRKTALVNGQAAKNPAHDEAPPEGGVLVGLRYTRNTFINSVQPIYLTAKGETLGTVIGDPSGMEVLEVKAEPGYAIGALNVRVGEIMDGFTVVFMRVRDTGLDATDAYRSETIGGGGGAAVCLGGDGRFMVGIWARTLADAYFVRAGAPATFGGIMSR